MILLHTLLLLFAAQITAAAVTHLRNHGPSESLAVRDGRSPHVLNTRRVKSRHSGKQQLDHVLATRSNNPPGHATHIADNHNIDFVANITFDGRPYEVWVDTGSSELWFVKDDFICTDPNTGKPTEQSVCQMGAGTSGTFKPIPDANMNGSYAGTWYVNGEVGTSDIGIAGLTVTNQTMGLIDRMYWGGDRVSSGLLGLQGFAGLMYHGTNLTADSPSNELEHQTLTTNMFASNLTKPIISFAQERNSANGWMAFGGIPPVQVGNYFASARLPPYKAGDYSNGAYFNFFVDSIVYTPAGNNTSQTVQRPHSAAHSTECSEIPLNTTVTVDNGSNFSGFPPEQANPLLNAYSPPAIFNQTAYRSYVLCNATAPRVGLKLANGIVWFADADMIYQDMPGAEGYCLTGIQAVEIPGNHGLTLLGDSFLNSIVAVWDYGNQEVRFTEHVY